MMIEENLNEIKNRISNYQKLSSVTIVAVTKKQTITAANKAIRLGITDIGENYAKQLYERNSLLLPAKRHLIGHLQTNKTKIAVEVSDLIQSVDSERVLIEISKHAKKLGKTQDVLIEINIANEQAKTGIHKNDLNNILSLCDNLENVKIKGLMAVLPKKINEKFYAEMFDIFNDKKNLKSPNVSMEILSMGMSNDFETALKFGSNMIRIGSRLFS